jgi:photosystem II stability/assembly factor-like uncharacterized protein
MTAGFLDEEYGITGGVWPGNMFYTEDGGEAWTEGTNESDCRYGIEIYDRQHAWSCGGMDQVVATTDGGRTWQRIADFGGLWDRPCRLMNFLDPQTGWLANQSRIGSTTDGGQTWTDLDLPDGVEHIAGIGLYAPGQGYLLDSTGRFYHTAIDGAHWTPASGPNLGTGRLTENTYAVVSMRFHDRGHGTIVLRLQTGEGERVMAYHTADGGATWTSVTVPVVPGPLYLSQDGRILTVLTGPDEMTVLRYTGE